MKKQKRKIDIKWTHTMHIAWTPSHQSPSSKPGASPQTKYPPKHISRNLTVQMTQWLDVPFMQMWNPRLPHPWRGEISHIIMAFYFLSPFLVTFFLLWNMKQNFFFFFLQRVYVEIWGPLVFCFSCFPAFVWKAYFFKQLPFLFLKN